MGRLRELLIREYDEFYKTSNADTIDPRNLSRGRAGLYEGSYGWLVNPLPKGSKVLDLGCGTGFFLAWLKRKPGVVPYGTDSSTSQVEVARKSLPGVEIECEDGLAYIKQRPSTFDAIFCFDVLEHIPDEDVLLEWCETARAALKPGGLFCFRSPNGAHLLNPRIRYIDLTHARSFTRNSALQLMRSARFENIKVFPARSTVLGSRLRLSAEALLHRVVYKVCGATAANDGFVFTSNINVVGYRPMK